MSAVYTISSSGVSQKRDTSSRLDPARLYQLDHEVPWERAMLHELVKIEKGWQPRRKPDRCILQHDKSFDRAYSYDESVVSQLSEAVPGSHDIFRQVIRQRDSLVDGMEDEFCDEPKISPPGSPKSVISKHPIRPEHDFKLPSVHRNMAFQEEASEWIEVETEDGELGVVHYTEVAMPDEPACNCWGYDILDFWLMPPPNKRRMMQKTPFEPILKEEIEEDPLRFTGEASRQESNVPREGVPVTASV